MAVADGMGGHRAGEVASSITVSYLSKQFNETFYGLTKDEAKDKEWLEVGDCSKYLAKIIYTLHIGGSISPILSATSKVLEDFAKN